jgi:primosomal protein N' (replication factor Y)
VPDKIIKARKTSEAATDSIPLIPFPSATSFNIPTLTVEQAQAVQEIGKAQGFTPFLLHGVTGSGKTEVYLQALMALLERTPQAQALILVPEINLTPQFEAIFRKRFSSWSSETIVTLHSGLAEGARARNWWAAHTARARIVLGTRLSVLASLPHLSLLIVDEEHDAAYKQQEGIRYSARDLAIWRAKSLNIPIILGSATPSLETWRHAESGRYTRLTLNQRALPDTTLPTIRLIDMAEYERRGQALVEGLSTPLLEALHTRLSCGEQSLIFLNRRGYAPSLVCHACGWVAGCLHCSVYLVWHKLEQSMQCHHCGERTNVPHACAACGSVDLAPFGQGTQRVEEALAAWLPQARIARIDADSTRKKGSAQALFDAVDAKEIDIMIGTQMITKGHDFKNVTLVGVLNADTALFSHDFRASERLFAQLIQASGRAGRTGGAGRGEVLIQTHYPQHPLYEALIHHDYHGFAANLLSERRQARLPPFTHQAILRAEATTLDAALTFLTKSASLLKTVVEDDAVTCYAPVPMIIAKVKNVHRAHLLVESGSRQALRRALDAWQILLRADKTRVRWFIEVDPIEF